MARLYLSFKISLTNKSGKMKNSPCICENIEPSFFSLTAIRLKLDLKLNKLYMSNRAVGLGLIYFHKHKLNFV